MSDLVVVERDGPIATVTLNRPQRVNAINPEMRDAFRETLVALMGDSGCRAIVVTGAGGNFSSGGDVTTIQTDNLLEARAAQAAAIQIIPIIAAGPKAVVAAVEGHCYGMAMGYAMACDYVVADATAKFSSRAPKIGLSAEEHGLAFTVSHRVGRARAKRLLTLSLVVDSAEAARIGLADEVVADGGALVAAKKTAMEYALAAPAAVAFTKAAMANGLEEALARELDHQSAILMTGDYREGVRAFTEKRPPRFSGN